MYEEAVIGTTVPNPYLFNYFLWKYIWLTQISLMHTSQKHN